MTGAISAQIVEPGAYECPPSTQSGRWPSWSRRLLSTQTGSTADVSCYIPLSNGGVMSRVSSGSFVGSARRQKCCLVEIGTDQLEPQWYGGSGTRRRCTGRLEAKSRLRGPSPGWAPTLPRNGESLAVA